MVRQSDPPAIIEFGNFRIFPHRRQLLADGRPIPLGGRAFDVLIALIEASGAVVSKDELLKVAWQGRIVDESRLAGEIVALRKAFGADRDLIRTVTGRGYQFTGEIRVRSEGERKVPDNVATAAEAPRAAEGDRASLPSPDEPSIAAASSPLRPRMSIVILPFLNLSQDPSEDYFVDGICDSLITDLSRALPGSCIISRSTAFTYKGRQVAIRQVGQELGVRYVLEGSVLARARNVRVNAQLIDAVTDEHLWAERFDKERKDIPEVQDEIVARLSRSVGIEMVRSEAARRGSGSGDGDVIDVVMRPHSPANDIKRAENAVSAMAQPLSASGAPIAGAVARRIRQPRRRLLIAACAFAAAISIAWWLWPATLFPRAEKPPDQATASSTPMKTAPSANPISQPLVAPRLSIVVLPFTNLSNDADQQYFADGITEDLTTDLSRISDMFVISRNSAFTYQGKRVDTKQIGRELGVRYVLEGSVQRSGNRVRLNAQLIDAETDAHLWAEQFGGDASDLFALQDEVTRRIAISLKLELIVVEATRPTRNLDALDLVLRGRSMYRRPTSRHRDDEIIGLFQRAVELDPGSVEAQFQLAAALAGRQLDGLNSSVADIEQAEALSLRALAEAPRDPVAHSARAQVLRAQGRLDEAISEYQIALASDRNNVYALANIGRCRIFIGPIEDGISAQQQAIRLSPRDPNVGLWYFRIGQGRLLQSRLEEAILWLKKARVALPELAVYHAYLAAAYALHGEAEQAVAQLTEAQRLDANYSSIAKLKLSLSRDQSRGARPEIRALFETTYLAGLRKAGMPEE